MRCTFNFELYLCVKKNKNKISLTKKILENTKDSFIRFIKFTYSTSCRIKRILRKINSYVNM